MLFLLFAFFISASGEIRLIPAHNIPYTCGMYPSPSRGESTCCRAATGIECHEHAQPTCQHPLCPSYAHSQETGLAQPVGVMEHCTASNFSAPYITDIRIVRGNLSKPRVLCL